MLTKIANIFLAILLFLHVGGVGAYEVRAEEWNTNYDYVFVHGLSGWGSYDPANVAVRYWGMLSGDLLGYLEKQGFSCHAASVDPTGSAWDRACELYAQLTGTRTDYGAAHSERCGHKRYGTDYSKKPLLNAWDGEHKINLVGHSFGGVTVRLLASLMANGSEAERSATDPAALSGLFAGGHTDWIYSITTLAAPHNGTTAYTITNGGEDIVGSTNKRPSGLFRGALANLINLGTQPIPFTKKDFDRASYDMFIDNAMALNETIGTLENTYYFSFPAASTDEKDGVQVPDKSITEKLFLGSGELMGKYVGVTENGVVLDESWQKNDGLVNTISARAPFCDSAKEYDENSVQPGVWNIMPEVRGDHTSFMGGVSKQNRWIFSFYAEHLDRVNRL